MTSSHAHFSLNTPFWILLILLLGLSGCTTTSLQPIAPTGNPLLDQAQMAERNQQPFQAARLYEQLALQSNSPEREQFQLKAVRAYLNAEINDEAARLIGQINITNLDPAQQQSTRFLLAELQIQQGKTEAALSTLEALSARELDQEGRIQLHRLRGEAYFQAGNLLESAQERVWLDSLLTDDASRLENQKSILDTLMLLSDQALDLLKPQPPNPLIGWMDLARVLKTRTSTDIDDPLVTQWRETHVDHMANQAFLEELLKQPTTSTRPVLSLAVFLPESGPFSAAAQAIRQGIVSAALSQSDNASPSLTFYDTESRSISELYALALEQGAEAIIGPLDKNRIAELAGATALTIPVLALNNALPEGPKNLYQFGLLPEEEAEQVAGLAWISGHMNALILTQQSDFGQRVARHFAESWTALGGSIQDVQAYRPEDVDHSVAIRNLLKLDDSAVRHRQLVNRLNLPVAFEERRRQDADFLFLVATPDSARAIKPQLRFHRAAGLDVYATSSVYSGSVNASADLDLNEITFCDMPWLIDAQDLGSVNAPQLAANWPNVQGIYKRLFSLGLDAYQILPQLPLLQSSAMGRIRGNSGILSMSASGHVKRQLTCAEYRNGKPNGVGLAPNLSIPQSNIETPVNTVTQPGPEAVTTPLPADRAQPNTF